MAALADTVEKLRFQNRQFFHGVQREHGSLPLACDQGVAPVPLIYGRHPAAAQSHSTVPQRGVGRKVLRKR